MREKGHEMLILTWLHFNIFFKHKYQEKKDHNVFKIHERKRP